MQAEAHRVVIAGGGFGGLNVARSLGRLPVEVTLIDRRNFHVFQPLLYQVATGALSPGDIAAPLRHVLSGQRNTRVLLAEITGIDVPGHRVLFEGGEAPYDTLILAPGAGTNYFGHPEWEEFAPGLKAIEDATEIRRRIFSAFEEAERESDPARRKSLLRFVVIGGGPTGVELAGAIAEIANDTLRGDFRNFRPEESEILLLEYSPRVLTQFPPELSEKAERALLRLGVRARTGVRVTSIDKEGVDLLAASGAQRIECHTVIWAAGVRASPMGTWLVEATGCKLDQGGRVMVEPDLTVPSHPEIFVVGDLARLDQDGKPLPGVAPVAIQQGQYVAGVIGKRLRSAAVAGFRYHDKGSLATIGRKAAVADLGFARFDGIAAWIFWLFLHLMYLVGFRNRVVVLIQWAFQYFTFNRGARLITGEAPKRGS